MPLNLPNLDDLSWEDLLHEALARIPASAPQWTNYNPSDPGITLVELLAFYTDLLLYRVNRIGDKQTAKFLELLNGHDWANTRHATHDLDHEKRLTLAALAKPRRAVTAADFETLAITAGCDTQLSPEATASRIKCVPERILIRKPWASEAEEESTPSASFSPTAPAPGHVSVVVLPQQFGAENSRLVERIEQVLGRARLLTTQVHVSLPRFIDFGIRITIVPKSDVSPSQVHAAALQSLKTFFDPYSGGPNGTGWPFGRNIYTSEIYQLLSALPGVNYVIQSRNTDTHATLSELDVPAEHTARLRLNRLNQLEAIEIHPGELVLLSIVPQDITVDAQTGGD